MTSQLRFDDKVAIITGAGGGLGRSYALLLASRGAKVVVNDLGGSHTGEGSSQSAADKVVDEIRDAGGEATANYNSVEDGDQIVKTAIDAYGRVDILINNAGILRDVSFHKMSQTDWDLIYKVHVYGSFRVTHAAWPIMREQRYGRVIMTASAAGIYGNFGQANYSTAKLGLLGFSNTLAREGANRNILVNTIAPIAGSRMTETVLPPNLIDALKPEYVAPLVARLCHESSEENGALFEVGGGFFAKLRWQRAEGKLFRVGRDITVEHVDKHWAAIASFDKTTYPDSAMASFQPVMTNVEAGPSKGGNDLIDVDEALGHEFPQVENAYDERDLALYALGVGAATSPTDDADLQLVYEMHGKGMKALPTYGVIPALNVMLTLARQGKTAPGLNYGLDRLLHGEQYTEIYRPLPTKAKLSHKAHIKDIFDKGKHALVITAIDTYDADGNKLVYNEFTSLIRGAGGWGGERGPSQDINTPPDRDPDKVIEEKIPDNQALLYRLSGDWNPLHADPGFAKAFGFDKPILHGLCTFGYAGRHVIQSFAPDGHPGYFRNIQTRFADSVFPGETLITEMWKQSDTKVVFRCKVKDRDSVVISNAAIEFYAEIPKPIANKAKKPAKVKATPISADIFNAMGKYIASHEDLVGKVKTVFAFKLSNPSSAWLIDLKTGKGAVTQGDGKAQCTLEMTDGDFMDMATGKADPMKLFSTGKLKISGDIMASQKLGFLKKVTPDMVIAEMKARVGSGDAGDAAGAQAAEIEPTSWDVFIAIRDHVARRPELVGKVGTIYLFKLTSPSSAWTLDLKNGAGSVEEGETKKPDCTLEIAESDFLDMTSGKSDPMKLFSTGKLKISGNIMASQKLEFLQKIDPEQAKAAVMKARAEGAGPTAAAADEAPAVAPKAAKIFAALGDRLSAKPELKDEVAAVVQFVITEPDAAWIVDLSGDAPSVSEGTHEQPATTLTMSDEHLAALVCGQASASELYRFGKMRVDGDVTVAHRLGFLKGLIDA